MDLNLITWNCNGAFRKKYQLLEEFQPDIVIVQECENPALCTDESYKQWAANSYWIGSLKHKGLGIFARDGIKLELLDWDCEGLQHFIPCRVNDDFTLIACWCHGANSPTFGYIGQLWKYMQLHKAKFGKCIIAGDFNSNVIWDKWDRWWNHSDVVRELRELQIESLYHLHQQEEPGKESQPTLYLQKNLLKPYHIDYIFASSEFSASLKEMWVGQAAQWLKYSDHMPVFCDIGFQCKLEKIYGLNRNPTEKC